MKIQSRYEFVSDFLHTYIDLEEQEDQIVTWVLGCHKPISHPKRVLLVAGPPASGKSHLLKLLRCVCPRGTEILDDVLPWTRYVGASLNVWPDVLVVAARNANDFRAPDGVQVEIVQLGEKMPSTLRADVPLILYFS